MIHTIKLYSPSFWYGFGALPFGMTWSVTGFYLSIFLLETALLDPLYVTLILVLNRFWDAITDPIVGYCVSYSKYSQKFGRLKLWMFFSLLPCGIFYALAWLVPKWITFGRFFYYLIIHLAFSTTTTMYFLPYTTMVVSIARDIRVRDMASYFRITFEMIGVLIGVTLQSTFLALFGQDSTGCIPKNESGNHEADEIRQYNPGMEMGYLYSGISMGVLLLAGGAVVLLGVKELPPEKVNSQNKKSNSIFKSIYATLKFKPYLILLTMSMFGWIAVNCAQTNFALFVEHSLGLGDEFLFVLVAVQASVILSAGAWQAFMFRFGKKWAYFSGSLLLLLSAIILAFVPEGQLKWLVYLAAIIAGSGICTLYLVPWSMLPDVVDAAFLSEGVRCEELFFSYFVFITKFGVGIAMGLSTVALKAAGYNENVCQQALPVKLVLRLMVTVAPCVLALVAQIFLVFYPISEKQRIANRKLIEIQTTSENFENGDYIDTSMKERNAIYGNESQLRISSTYPNNRENKINTRNEESVKLITEKDNVY